MCSLLPSCNSRPQRPAPPSRSPPSPPSCRVEAREQLRRQVGTLRLDLNTLASAKAGKEDKKKALALRQDFLTKVRSVPGLANAAQGYWCWCCVGGTHACTAALQALDVAAWTHSQAVVARHCAEALISCWRCMCTCPSITSHAAHCVCPCHPAQVEALDFALRQKNETSALTKLVDAKAALDNVLAFVL